jgi:hypothetical protein
VLQQHFAATAISSPRAGRAKSIMDHGMRRLIAAEQTTTLQLIRSFVRYARAHRILRDGSLWHGSPRASRSEFNALTEAREVLAQ